MSDPKQEGVRGKLHLVKLYDRKVQLQVEYHSPQKKQLEASTADIIIHRYKLNQSSSIKALKKQRDERKNQSKRLQLSQKDPPLFYRKKVFEVNQMERQYEQFHQKMIERKVQRKRIKVVSNSKEIKQLRAKQKEKLNFQVKDINIKQENNNKKKPQIPVRKITLFSPEKYRYKNYKPKQNTIKLYENIHNQDMSVKATPVRKKHKLQVTSSRSRNKYDSLLVSQQKSLEVKKMRMEEETPKRKMKTVTSAFQVSK